MHATHLSRRSMLTVFGSLLGSSASGWFPAFAAAAAQDKLRKRSCILLWMNGGPATIDLFDLKVGHDNGGPSTEIATSVPGLKISAHLPQLARHAHHLGIIRSMSTREGDHGRGAYFLHTGYMPTGALQYPTLGSLISKELGDENADLPDFISVSPFRLFSRGAYGPGFLGPNYAPLVVGESNRFSRPQLNEPNLDRMLRVSDLERPKEIDKSQAESRELLLRELDSSFLSENPSFVAKSHRTAYDRASNLMQSSGARAFDLSSEPEKVRNAYGRNIFGQGCLLARRLVERGVSFIEVNLGGWDTHDNNFVEVQKQCEILDSAWSNLMTDLQDRGLLESTTILWMGEFGRTPKINQGKGRDHFPNAWSAVLAGGGIHGGQTYGTTSPDGTTVESEPTTAPDLLATLCKAMGIDPTKQNNSNVGRPIRIADKSAKVVKPLVG